MTMGSYLQTYLGPYVECFYRDSTRTDFVFGCTKSDCPEYKARSSSQKRWKFCPECGGPSGTSGKEVLDRSHRYDVVGDALCDLTQDGGNRLFLAPNVSREGEPRRGFADGDEAHVDITEIDMSREMTWFADAFAKEIMALIVAYDNVTVKWGFHQFYH